MWPPQTVGRTLSECFCVMGLMSEPLTIDTSSDDPLEEEDSSAERRPVELTQTEPPDGIGFALRLQETEGQYQGVNVEFFRAPSSARVRDFRGQTVVEIPIEGDGLRVDLSPFAIVDLEVRFD